MEQKNYKKLWLIQYKNKGNSINKRNNSNKKLIQLILKYKILVYKFRNELNNPMKNNQK